MRKTKLFIYQLLLSIVLISCNKAHKEVSSSELINNILPKVEVKDIEVEDLEKVLVHTYEDETFQVNLSSMNSMEREEFLAFLTTNTNSMSYSTAPNSFSILFTMLQFLPVITLLLILIHIILLWIALKRIIKSNIDNMEKLVYTIISIFFPFFGPIIYLTAGKKR